MTIASTPRKAGPLLGNGSATTFPFTFKVFSAADIQVVVADGVGVETVLALGTDYTVALNPNQDTSPGGTVTYPVSGSPLPGNGTLSIVGDTDYDQPLDLPSGGNYSPLALENQLDRIAMQVQQLKELVSRTVKLPVTSTEDADALVADVARIADSADNIGIVAGGIDNVNAVADSVTNINLVAQNLVDVTNFADVYMGAKANDPATRNDGSGLVVGDIYFNTSSAGMRVYSLGGWLAVGVATPITVVPQSFSGNGSTTTFTLSSPPAFEAACDVYISGVAQKVDVDYNIVGTSLVFTSAPPAGTSNIYTKTLSSYAGGVPNDGSVTPAKVSPGTYGIDITGNAATADAVDGLTITPAGAMSVPAVQGAFKTLVLSTTGTSALVTVTADALAVSNGPTHKTLTSVSLSLSLASTGANGLDTGTAAANTWYSVWVIWNGTTTSGLLSLSGTAPTLPSGYTHKARVGWIRTDGTANKYPLSFKQYGRRAYYAPVVGSNLTDLPSAASGSTGGETTYVSVSLASFVPTTASAVDVVVRQATDNASQAHQVRAKNTGTRLASAYYYNTHSLLMPIIDTLTIYRACGDGGGILNISGWEDNL